VRDYNLAVLYSREFYSLVRHHLRPGGFVAIDTPSGSCIRRDSLWPVYSSTLHAAGFRTVVSYASHLNLDGHRVEAAIDDLAAHASLQAELGGGRERDLGYAERRDILRRYTHQELEIALQEFVLAFPDRRAVNTQWIPFGVPLRVFGPAQLPAAFSEACPRRSDPRLVNSIFRPTLPPLAFLAVRFP
jgi:hypothetical protein